MIVFQELSLDKKKLKGRVLERRKRMDSSRSRGLRRARNRSPRGTSSPNERNQGKCLFWWNTKIAEIFVAIISTLNHPYFLSINCIICVQTESLESIGKQNHLRHITWTYRLESCQAGFSKRRTIAKPRGIPRRDGRAKTGSRLVATS